MQNKEYRGKHRQQVRTNSTRKLLSDSKYQENNRNRAKINTKRRLLTNHTYKQENCERARQRHKCMSTNYNYREYHRKISYSKRQNYNTCVTENRSQAKGKCTDRQKYWVRRSKILAHFRRQSYEYKQQRKMTAASTVSSLAVKITFEKAKRTINRGLCKVKRLHVYLSEKSKACTDQLPHDRTPTEEEFTAAMDGQRAHNRSSEPYFWEQAYKVARLENTIPVDTSGSAHIFNSIDSSCNNSPSTPSHGNIKHWECHKELCLISTDSKGSKGSKGNF